MIFCEFRFVHQHKEIVSGTVWEVRGSGGPRSRDVHRESMWDSIWRTVEVQSTRTWRVHIVHESTSFQSRVAAWEKDSRKMRTPQLR